MEQGMFEKEPGKRKGTKGTERTKEAGAPPERQPLRSLSSLRSPQKPIIPPHGGYQQLHSFQKARIVYDGTVHFCGRFIDPRSRTHDQMIQAARSGKQNILEGSQASGTSKETEIKLTNVARASMEELLEDYRDFLRTRSIKEWSKDHPGTRRLRELNRNGSNNYAAFQKGIEHPDPAIAANVLIGLIKLTSYLLDRQIAFLEKAFLQEGGLRERMTQARLAARAQNHRPPPENPR